MFRRYHHGHSAALGFLLALSLYGHALVYSLLLFTAGLLIGRSWAWWALVTDALRHKWHLARRETIATTPQPVYPTRRRGPGNLPDGY